MPRPLGEQQIVSMFNPLDTRAILGKVEAERREGLEMSTMLSNLYGKLYEEPSYGENRQYIDKAIDNVRSAVNEVTNKYYGRMDLAIPELLNVISTAKKDPIWQLNRQHLQAVEDFNQQLLSYKGKPTYIFNDPREVSLLTPEGEYTNPAKFTGRITEFPDLNAEQLEIWKNILSEESFEGLPQEIKTGLLAGKNMYEVITSSGISDRQVLNKVDQAFELLKETEDYRVLEEITADQMAKQDMKFDKAVYDAEMKANFLKTGKLMMHSSIGRQIAQIPTNDGTGGGKEKDSSPWWTNANINTYDNVFTKSNFEDLSKIAKGDYNYGTAVKVKTELLARKPVQKFINPIIKLVKELVNTSDEAKLKQMPNVYNLLKGNVGEVNFRDLKKELTALHGGVGGSDTWLSRIASNDLPSPLVSLINPFQITAISTYSSNLVRQKVLEKINDLDDNLIDPMLDRLETEYEKYIVDKKGSNIVAITLDNINYPTESAAIDKGIVERANKENYDKTFRINGKPFSKVYNEDTRIAKFNNMYVDNMTGNVVINADLEQGTGQQKVSALNVPLEVTNMFIANDLNKSTGNLLGDISSGRFTKIGDKVMDNFGNSIKFTGKYDVEQKSDGSKRWQIVSKDDNKKLTYQEVANMTGITVPTGINPDAIFEQADFGFILDIASATEGFTWKNVEQNKK